MFTISKTPPKAEYAFCYAKKPKSGNVINGLGEKEIRKPKVVFHSGDYSVEWADLEFLFHNISTPKEVFRVICMKWQHRKKDGFVAQKNQPVSHTASTTEEIRNFAKKMGITTFGVTPLDQQYIFEGIELPYINAVCLGMPMDRKEMAHVANPRGSLEIMETYRRVGNVAVSLAKYIRKMGWAARAIAGMEATDLLHIPLAVNAGLGQLGKHGSLISMEFGSNLRLSTVLTDLPLKLNSPIDIGVDDFCTHCQICKKACPADAISSEKQWVRGTKRWYVDFDKCVPYFCANYACGICIEVCPWSEAGRGKLISRKMIARRENRVRRY
jgi:reductive dehalogenase